jgi:hypothetical protein
MTDSAGLAADFSAGKGSALGPKYQLTFLCACAFRFSSYQGEFDDFHAVE